MTPPLISLSRFSSAVTPRRRSRSSSVRNISATQVLLQSNFSPVERDVIASRTLCRLAPHCRQNLRSSLICIPHPGQNIAHPPELGPELGPEIEAKIVSSG